MFVFAVPNLAQPAPVKLTLEQAKGLALKNQPRIQAAQHVASAMDQKVAEARAAYYPTLTGQSTSSQANPQGRIGAGSLSTSRLFDRVGVGLTLNQLITDFGRTANLVASSRLQAGAAQQNYQAAQYDVVLAATRAYFELLRGQALVKVAQDTVVARQALVDQVTALFNNKLRSRLDVSFADVNLAQARLLLLQSQNRVLEASAELTRALGAAQPVTYELVEEPLPPAPPANPEGLVAQALVARPELASLQMSRDAAYRYERAEKDLTHPTVDLAGVGGFIPYINQITQPRLVPAEYEGVALNIQVPILNGGLFRARREEARYRSLEAEQKLRDEEEVIARDVRTVWADVSTAYQRLGVTAEMRREAALALDLAQGRYQLGLASIVELTQAQLGLTEAEIEDLSAKYDYQFQYSVLLYTLGALR